MHGSASASAPTRYGVLITVMEKMGWSWVDLCDAPADLVDEIAARTLAERHWTAERQQLDAQMQQAQEQMSRGKRG